MEPSRTWLSVGDICERLGVSPRTFEKWHYKGVGPRMVKLPNRTLRCREDWYEDWLASLPGASPDEVGQRERPSRRARRTAGDSASEPRTE